jgi:hypothetical protein
MAGYRQWGVARAPAGPPRGGRAVLPRTQDALPQGACGHESQWTWALVGALVTDLHFELWIGDAPAVRAKRVGSKKPIASTPQCAETYFTAPGAAALATHGVIRPLAGPRKNWRPTRAYPLIASWLLASARTAWTRFHFVPMGRQRKRSLLLPLKHLRGQSSANLCSGVARLYAQLAV